MNQRESYKLGAGRGWLLALVRRCVAAVGVFGWRDSPARRVSIALQSIQVRHLLQQVRKASFQGDPLPANTFLPFSLVPRRTFHLEPWCRYTLGEDLSETEFVAVKTLLELHLLDFLREIAKPHEIGLQDGFGRFRKSPNRKQFLRLVLKSFFQHSESIGADLLRNLALPEPNSAIGQGKDDDRTPIHSRRSTQVETGLGCDPFSPNVKAHPPVPGASVVCGILDGISRRVKLVARHRSACSVLFCPISFARRHQVDSMVLAHLRGSNFDVLAQHE